MHGLYKFDKQGRLAMVDYVPAESNSSSFQKGHFYRADTNGFVEAIRPQKPSNALRRALHSRAQNVK